MTQEIQPAAQANTGNEFLALSCTQSDLEDLRDAFLENMAGETFTIRDIDRVKVPGEGAVHWQIPSSKGPKLVEKMEVILLDVLRPRARWSKPFNEVGAVPPDCYSLDGETGYGNPGGKCFTCEYDQYGSTTKEGSNAKGCPEQRVIFALRPDRLMPMILQLPPTSIANVKEYRTRLMNDGIKQSSVKTQVTLEKVQREKQYPYSRATFLNVGTLTDEEKIGLSRYRERTYAPIKAEVDRQQQLQLDAADMKHLQMLSTGEINEEDMTSEGTGTAHLEERLEERLKPRGETQHPQTVEMVRASNNVPLEQTFRPEETDEWTDWRSMEVPDDFDELPGMHPQEMAPAPVAAPSPEGPANENPGTDEPEFDPDEWLREPAPQKAQERTSASAASALETNQGLLGGFDT